MSKRNRSQKRPHRRDKSSQSPPAAAMTPKLLLGAIIVAVGAAAWLMLGPSRQPEERRPVAEKPSEIAQSPPAEPEAPPREPEAVPPKSATPPPLGEYTPPATIEELQQEELEMVKRMMEEFPDDPNPVALMGNVYSNRGDNSEAAKCWQRSSTMDPKRISAFNALAMIAQQKGEDETAVELLRKALQADPKQVGANHKLGKSLMALNRLPEAIAALEKELAILSQSPETHFLLGKAYMQTKEYEKAKANYQRAIELSPSHTSAYYGLATACARLGLKDEFKQHMAKFNELKANDVKIDRKDRAEYADLKIVLPRVSGIYTDAAEFYRGQGNLRKAEAYLLRAAAIDSTNPICRIKLILLYQQTGRAEQALPIFEQLLKLNPDDVTPRMNMGVLYVQLKRFDEAEAMFQEVIELAPQGSAGYRLLAQSYLDRKKNFPEAMRLAREAVRREPIAANYFVLGAAYAKNNDLAGARSAMQRAVELAPRNQQYRRSYEQLLRMQ